MTDATCRPARPLQCTPLSNLPPEAPLNPNLVEEITTWLTGLGAGEALLVVPIWAPCTELGEPLWKSGLAWLDQLQAASGSVRSWRTLIHGRRQLRVWSVSQGLHSVLGVHPEIVWCGADLPLELELDVRGMLPTAEAFRHVALEPPVEAPALAACPG